MKGLLIYTEDWIRENSTPRDGTLVKTGLNDPNNDQPYNALKFWWRNDTDIIWYDIKNIPYKEVGFSHIYPHFACTGNMLRHTFLELLTNRGYMI